MTDWQLAEGGSSSRRHGLAEPPTARNQDYSLGWGSVVENCLEGTGGEGLKPKAGSMVQARVRRGAGFMEGQDRRGLFIHSQTFVSCMPGSRHAELGRHRLLLSTGLVAGPEAGAKVTSEPLG